MDLLQSIRQAEIQLEVAESIFNHAEDPELIDIAIIDMLSAEKKLNRLRKLAKKEGVKSGNYITSFR
ncbi:hypothetical protein Y919_02630 [Caloranaerobacter azorensis H53214]|uniref:Uncharacterized protein n=2 Tax=Caloranaerobacter azorensis TaxID=116090 RepID=A0A1M5TUN2_9FIRM|nr:hypothetical protein [Caloranaerobacter azorensis]KGG81077.1 hypothetical protein Y919_02630 [Caloranaerobacter azorensis H53214]SHH54497.1 hypothetical protein SAMN02745135_01147 [Caloranaerobacter azorensis DSM 13643]